VERSASPVRQAGGRAARDARLRQIRELVAGGDVENQQQLADLLTARGFQVTQTTVSRDIAALGLAKVFRGDRHVYVVPGEIAQPRTDDALLRRVLGDIPIDVRRSGLTLLLISTPGTASIVAEAIDRSGLDLHEGTLAGDNTVLVLFADARRLERWRSAFEQTRELATRQA
jgi:transcriptional regulator of arginine metabolism